MNYRFMTSDEQDDIVVSFLAAQERDAYCHEVNLARYNEMLKTLPPGKWRDHISQLKAETEERLAEVTSIIAATSPPPEPRLQAALTRLSSRNRSTSA